MGSSIVDIKNMGDALRNTGYKNIESAAAEIVDNSIEANAANVFIVLSESINPISGRKVVTEIGFLDNGSGMNDSGLGNCLAIGATTRKERKGMGRFGVGLPQASLHACPQVDVYSWQNGIENCKKVFLDIEKVKEGSQTEIEDPVLEKLPEKYAKYICYRTEEESYDFSQSGTLVIWHNCDRVKPRTRGPLTEHLEFALGQKFRYFIHNNESKIKIICDENQESAVDVLPNDPLFLMEDNLVMCDPKDVKKIYKSGSHEDLEPVFELYTDNGNGTGEETITITYINKNGVVTKSSVLARFSCVKDKFYDETAFPGTLKPGSYNFGQHAKKMEGISIIRANREIDFGRFDFYDVLDKPEHRWWGCEIIFTPELDEVFGVANNKQYVDLKKTPENDVDSTEEVRPIWLQLVETIKSTIDRMYEKNKETRKGTRTPEEAVTPATNIINNVENDNDEDEEKHELLENITQDEKIQKGKEELKNLGYPDATDEQATEFFKNNVIFDYADRGERSPAFDYKISFSTTIITINTSHQFYASFLNKIYDNVEVKTSFELFMASLYQSIRKTNTYQKDENDKLMTTWYSKLNEYIQEMKNPRNTK